MLFRTPPCILDSVTDLPLLRDRILLAGGTGPFLLVSGPRVSATPAFLHLERAVASLNLELVEYIKPSGEPDSREVSTGAALYRDAGCTGIIACGGGSQLDTAKGIALLAAHGGEPADYRGTDKVPGPLPFLIAVAATAGSGSEATPYTVITDAASGEKMLIASTWLLPAIAVADHRFLRHAPPAVLAAAGIDAFCHALEAFVSRKATTVTDALALAALPRIAANLPVLLDDPGDEAAARALAAAATLAGLCIGNSSVTLLHGMSRPLGVRFHISHGLANALLLPVWASFTEWFAKEKFARALAAVNSACPDKQYPSIQGLLTALLTRTGIPSLAGLIPDRQALATAAGAMATAAVASGSPANNPGQVTAVEIEALYLRAWDSRT